MGKRSKSNRVISAQVRPTHVNTTMAHADVAVPAAFFTGEELKLSHVTRSEAMQQQLATDVTEVEEHAIKEIEIANGVAVLDGPSAAQIDGRESESESESEGETDDDDDDSDSNVSIEVPAEVAMQRSKPLKPVPPADVHLYGNNSKFGSKAEADSENDFGGSDVGDADDGDGASDVVSQADATSDDDSTTDADEDVDRSRDTAIQLSRTDISDAVRHLKAHPKYQTEAVNPALQRALAKVQAERTQAPPKASKKAVQFTADTTAPIQDTVARKAAVKIAQAKAPTTSVTKQAAAEVKVEVKTKLTSKDKAKGKVDDDDSLTRTVPLRIVSRKRAAAADADADADSVEEAVAFHYRDQMEELRAQVAEAKLQVEAKAKAKVKQRDVTERVAAEAARHEREKKAHAAAFEEIALLKQQLAELQAHADADAAEAHEMRMAMALRDARAELEEEEALLTPAQRRVKEKEAARIEVLAGKARADRERRRAKTAHEADDIAIEVARLEKERAEGMEEALRAILDFEAKKEAEAAAKKAAESKGKAKGRGDTTSTQGHGKVPSALLDQEENEEDDAILAKFLAENGGPVELEDHEAHVGWMRKMKLKDDSHTVNRKLEELEKAHPEIIRRAKAEYQRVFEEEELARTKLKTKAMARVDPAVMKKQDDAKEKTRELVMKQLAAARNKHSSEMELKRRQEREEKLKKEFATWHLKDALTRLWIKTTGHDAEDMPRKFLLANATKAQGLCKLEVAAPETMARLWKRFSEWQSEQVALTLEAEADAEAEAEGKGGRNQLKVLRDALHARREGPPRSFSGATSGVHLAAVSHSLLRKEGPPRNACDE